jgi:hypothetical protein
MMRNRSTTFGVVVVALLGALAGCTYLASYHYDPDVAGPEDGSFPYALVRTRIQVTYTLQLTDCGVTPADPNEVFLKVDPNVPSIGVKVTATVGQTFEADPNEKYYIKTKKLTGFWKNTSLKVTTASDQSLQSLNTEYSDQTLQVAGAALQTAASVAGDVMIAANPVGAMLALRTTLPIGGKAAAVKVPAAKHAAPKPAPAKRLSACLPSVATALEKYQSLQKSISAEVKNSKAGNPASDAAVSYETSQLSAQQTALTITLIRNILPDPSQFTPSKKDLHLSEAPTDMNLSAYVRAAWIDPENKVWGPKAVPTMPVQVVFNQRPVTLVCPDKTVVTAAANGACLLPPPLPAPASGAAAAQAAEPVTDLPDSQIIIYAYEATLPAGVGTKGGSYTSDQIVDPSGDKSDGVMLRQPAIGYARVCMGHCKPADSQGIVMAQAMMPDYDLTATKTPLTIPQLGKHYKVKMHAHIGDDVNVGFTLGADGAPLSLSLTNTSTAAQGMTSVGSAANAYSAAVTAQNGAITAANGAVTAQEGIATSNASLAVSNAQLNDNKLKAQSDCLTQQAAIIKLGATPVTTCQ